MRGPLFGLIYLLFFVSTSCHKTTHPSVKDDFHQLMGFQKSVWHFVKTLEDQEHLAYFKEIYEKNKNRHPRQNRQNIPKTIHFIWIGNKEFPKDSIKNVQSWLRYHPDWTIKFWTDRWRTIPDHRMSLHLVSQFPWKYLKPYFDASENEAEKSNILRYEILYREGGLYVDHDVKCFAPFDSFHEKYGFYCGLEPPHNVFLSSSIVISNSIIGANKNHPILKKTIESIQKNWDMLSLAYPNQDQESVLYRTTYRTFSPFNDATREMKNFIDRGDMVFPAAYFNRIDHAWALYAHHTRESTWIGDQHEWQNNVKHKITNSVDNMQSTKTYALCTLIVQMLLSIAIYSLCARKRRIFLQSKKKKE